MYAPLLMAHSLSRWVVLAAVAVRAGVAVHGSATGRPAGAPDRRASLVAMILVDLQFLLGILLHLVFSPITTGARGDVGAAMKDGAVRWALVEHPTMMILGVGLAHVGNVLTRRATLADPAAGARNQRILTALSLLTLLLLLVGSWRR